MIISEMFFVDFRKRGNDRFCVGCCRFEMKFFSVGRFFGVGRREGRGRYLGGIGIFFFVVGGCYGGGFIRDRGMFFIFGKGWVILGVFSLMLCVVGILIF